VALEADAVVKRLEASPVLELLPPDTTAREPYSKRPCDDEDNRGSVSRQLTSTLEDRELLAYFREEFPKKGWGLRQELADLPREPDGLRTGEPNQCYENPARTAVRTPLLRHRPAEHSRLSFWGRRRQFVHAAACDGGGARGCGIAF
jgi:hypothetical protein